MGLTTSLNTALTGLSAAARATDVVSSNIANAQTDGYGRRTLGLATSVSTAGVRITGVLRQSDVALLAERRMAGATEGASAVALRFIRGVEDALGAADDETSLAGRVATLDAALIQSVASPDSDSSLAAVVTAARSLADLLNTATDLVQAARQAADQDIASQVSLLNSTLSRLADLNDQIGRYGAQSRDTSALLDQRQQLIDGIAQIVPLREVARENGQISLYTLAGVALVDGGRASEIGFSRTTVITADMSLASGALSGLTVDGRAVSTTASGGFAGGTLAAAFALRDEQAPQVQRNLDAVARDMIERFAAADTTLAAGQAGLFTDAGGDFDPLTEAGLAGRIAVNPAVDPAQGGELWRLRSGIGAATAAAPGDSTRLSALSAALTTQRLTASGGLEAGSRNLSGLASDVMSWVAGQRLTAESTASYSAARAETLRMTEAGQGIDTDVELQDLMLIEQAYAANAKVISTIDQMFQTLLEM